VDDDEEDKEVVRGLDVDFSDCEIVEGGDRDYDEDEDSEDERFSECEMVEGGDSDGDEDSDYVEFEDDGSGTVEILDEGVEKKRVVKEQKKRKRTGGDEGGRKNKPSVERSAGKKEGRRAEETDNVEVLIKGKVATVRDLFTRERKNINVDGISYSSGTAIETRRYKKIIEYKKVYRCLMVMNRKNKREGWSILASHRDRSNKDYVGCKGRMEGYFMTDRYWFRMKHCHTCDKGGGSLDNRPRIQMISPAPGWNITKKSLLIMRKVLETCPKHFWENLTHQGTSRQWLKEIVAPRNEQGESVKLQIEEMMKPYLDMVKYQNPHLRFCRVGALRTQPESDSQYKKSGNQLHADYPETVKMRYPDERPVSIIMALDEPFKFLYEDKDNNDDDDDVDEDDICELMVNRGHAIAFTDELFHAGGENSTKRENYRLFAYVVSDEKDYPNNMVFTKNKANMEKLNAARKKRG
jgi:hypothetical protein